MNTSRVVTGIHGIELHPGWCSCRVNALNSTWRTYSTLADQGYSLVTSIVTRHRLLKYIEQIFKELKRASGLQSEPELLNFRELLDDESGAGLMPPNRAHKNPIRSPCTAHPRGEIDST